MRERQRHIRPALPLLLEVRTPQSRTGLSFRSSCVVAVLVRSCVHSGGLYCSSMVLKSSLEARALGPEGAMSFSGTEAVVWTSPMDSTFWASLISPTTNLLRSSTVMDCGNGGDVGLPGGVAGGCGETDGFSIGAIISAMDV